jgi:hypothetical protein
MTGDFTSDDAIVAADEDTGDAVIWAGDAAASFAYGAWRPGIFFDRMSILGNDSRFGSVEDPAAVQRYLDAAHDALVRSLSEADNHD